MQQKFTKQFAALAEMAGGLAVQCEADALLVLLDGSTDWEKLRESISHKIDKIIVAADAEKDLDGAKEAGLILIASEEKSPLLERLQHALLEAVETRFSKITAMLWCSTVVSNMGPSIR